MADWWQDEIIDGGKLALLLCTLSFLVTFAVTRIIVRSIRAGKSRLSNNVVGGVHVHHAVPGVILMAVGGLAALGAQVQAWEAVAGVAFGAGLALVLDEFALILHLDDVYWSAEGRTSVDAVFLTAGVLVLVLLGAIPLDLDSGTGTGNTADRVALLVVILVNLFCVGVTFAKGKLGSGIVGFVVPFVAWVGAVRLARPSSPWAHRRYPEGSPKALAAAERDARFDVRWRSRVRRIQDAVAGTLGG
ncbi:MAG TPA: hypothetical protein VIY72_03770 [Acidimicrobiales bacterium]